jgi:general secretion pathway protein I
MASSGRLRPRRPEQAGFTLAEVLVAVAVLAIALAAVMRVTAQSAGTAADIRDRMQGLWVAEDRLALKQMRHVFPPPDTTSGDTEWFGRRWYWTDKIQTTQIESIRRIEIEIRAKEKGPVLGHVVGLLRTPAP